MSAESLIELVDVHKVFEGSRREEPVHALDGVSLSVTKGRSMALVGESGSGKTTLARTVLGLCAPTSGVVRLLGDEVYGKRKKERGVNSPVQVVFQNPHSSLNPSSTVAESICEPLRWPRLSQRELKVRAEKLLEMVGLDSSYLGARPRELSGGQQQRVAIARAIAPEPALVVLDEPTASVDVAARRSILLLLDDLQKAVGTTYLFVTHDLVSASYIARDTTVLYRGSVVEQGPTASVLSKPTHGYTKLLVSSALSTHRTEDAEDKVGKQVIEEGLTEWP